MKLFATRHSTILLAVAAAFATCLRLEPIAAGEIERAFEDEIVYVVIMQKFANGDPSNDVMAERFAQRRQQLEGGFWGGDLAGVRGKLDYFVELGVTALLLYPVVENDRAPMGRYLPTGYRPRNYFRVDENFGDLAVLKSLVKEAHRRGLRVILDLPLGMPGFEYPELHNLRKQRWLGPPTRYGLRQWNAENQETADFLIRVARFWRDETGCDGFRLDSAQFHDVGFWKRFVHELKQGEKNGDFLLLAELPLSPQDIDRTMRAAGFDGAYDFSAGIARDVFGQGRPIGVISAVLCDSQAKYHNSRSMMAQLDNYEDPTFLASAQSPSLARMRMAMTYLLTLDRVPLIYPGNEQAVSCRVAGDLFPADASCSNSLESTKQLIALRKSEPALRRGEFEEVLVQQPVYAYLRQLGDERILIVFNVGAEAAPLQTAIDGMSWKDCRLEDLLADETSKQTGDGAALTINGFSSRVFRVSVHGR